MMQALLYTEWNTTQANSSIANLSRNQVGYLYNPAPQRNKRLSFCDLRLLMSMNVQSFSRYLRRNWWTYPNKMIAALGVVHYDGTVVQIP